MISFEIKLNSDDILSFDLGIEDSCLTCMGILTRDSVKSPMICKVLKSDYTFQDFYWKEDLLTAIQDRFSRNKFAFEIQEGSVNFLFSTILDVKNVPLSMKFSLCESNTFVLEKFIQLQTDLQAVKKTNTLNYQEIRVLAKEIKEITRQLIEIKRLIVSNDSWKTKATENKGVNKRLVDLNHKIENKCKATEQEVSLIRSEIKENHKIVRNLEDFLNESYVKTDEQFRLLSQAVNKTEKEEISQILNTSREKGGKPVTVSELFEVEGVFVGYESYAHQVCPFTTVKNHSFLCFATETKKLVLFCLAKNAVLTSLEGHLENINSIKHLTHDDKDYVVSTCNSRVIVHRVVGTEMVRVLTVNEQVEQISAAALFPKHFREEVYLGIATDCGSIRVFDLDGMLLKEAKTKDDDNFDLGFFIWKDKEYLYTGNQCSIKVFDAFSLEKVKEFKHPHFVYFIGHFERDGTVFLVGLFDSTIKIFDFAKGKESVQCLSEKSLAGLALWNEQYLLTGDAVGNLKFYDMVGNRMYKTLRVYEEGFISVMHRFVDSAGRDLLVTGQWATSKIKVLEVTRN